MNKRLASVLNVSFLGLLGMAPALYGSIPLWAENMLVFGCYLLISMWILLMAIRFNWPLAGYMIPLIAAMVLVAQGWWMVLNAKYILEPTTHQLIPLANQLVQLPGSMELQSSKSWMWKICSFLGIVFFTMHLSKRRIWRLRVLYAIAITAGVLTAFAIVQKISGIQGIWPQYGRNVWPFGTYFYHGNAGAYMNLALPILFVLVIKRIIDDRRDLWSSLWPCLLVIVLAGCLVNASKGAMIVTLLICLAFVPVILKALWRNPNQSIGKYIAYGVSGIIFLGTFAAIMFSGGIEQSWTRWDQALHSKETIYLGRQTVARYCYLLGMNSGWFGFGPDTFHVIFPYVVKEGIPQVYGYWRYAHHDYLQTLLEWGIIGTLAWSFLFFGAIATAINQSIFIKTRLRTKDRLYLYGVAVSLGGIAFHALYDFPLQIPSLQFYVAVLMGYAWGSSHWPRIRLKTNRRRH